MPQWITRRRMFPLVFSLTLLVALLAAACQQPTAPSPPASGAQPAATTSGSAQLTKVNLRLNWTIKDEFAPPFVAREEGYY